MNKGISGNGMDIVLPDIPVFTAEELSHGVRISFQILCNNDYWQEDFKKKKPMYVYIYIHMFNNNFQSGPESSNIEIPTLQFVSLLNQIFL